jgi:hypothetical protein
MNTIFAADMRRKKGAGKRAILRHSGRAKRDPGSRILEENSVILDPG